MLVMVMVIVSVLRVWFMVWRIPGVLWISFWDGRATLASSMLYKTTGIQVLGIIVYTGW